MMARSPHWFCRWVLVLILSFFGPGCGGEGDELPREAVWGTVNLDGRPLEKGTIQFSPVAQGSQATAVEGGGMIESGKFSIPRDRGLVPGDYHVAIYSGGSGAPAKGPNGPITGGPAPKKETIPANYNAKTTLKADVKKGVANDFNFDLTSK